MYHILMTPLALAFASLASAQNYASVAAASAAAATHTVQVGPNGTLTYSPSNITADVGDMVLFKFNPKNHTVTQSNFANPCVPLSNSTKVIDSGFVPVGNTSAQVTFNFTVNGTQAMWFFCKQPDHCAKGMVFAVNPDKNGPSNFTAFLQKALASGNSTTGSSSTTVNSSPTGNSSTAIPTGTAIGIASPSNPVNLGLTAILSVAGIVMLAL